MTLPECARLFQDLGLVRGLPMHATVEHGRLLNEDLAARRTPELVSTVNKLILIFLVIPLLIVMAAKDPQGMGHLVQLIITIGAKLLNAVAALLNNLLSSPAH
jgi:hypothetical protein